MKKFISLLLALVLMFTIVAVSFATDRGLGDANGDGNITALDARLALRISAKLETVDESVLKAADIDGNGNVTAVDARIILRFSTKLDFIENYTKEEPITDEPATDEPTTDETTTQEPMPEMPAEIAAFCDGNYYIEGNYGGENIKMAVKGKIIEVSLALDGTEMGFYTNGAKNKYLINYKNKTFVSLEDVQAFASGLGSEFDIIKDLDLSNISLGKITIDSATAEKTTVDGKEAYLWTITSNNANMYFTVVDGKITKIENSNHETLAEVTMLTAELPANFYISNSKQFKGSTALQFMVALMG